MSTLGHEIRLAFRSLAKSPGLSLVAVATLSLGIGVTASMFSIVNAVLLRPLPFPAAERLVFVRDIQPQLDNLPASYPEFLDWKGQGHLFEEAGAYWRPPVTLTGEGDPERVDAIRLTPNLLALFGIEPLFGRPLLDSDDLPGAEKVALLSYSLWQRRYGGDREIVGRPIAVDGERVTVVGILPAEARSATPTEIRRSNGNDIWLPLRLTVESSRRGSHYLTVVARLREDVTYEQAEQGIAVVSRSFQDDGRTEHGIMLEDLTERIAGTTRTPVLLLMAAVGFVLFIACANIANLLLARASSRRKEMAIRGALGASRWRLARQLLLESLLLSAAGGTLGLLLATWGVALFSASPGANWLRTGTVSLDPTVLGFSLALILLTGLFFGSAPVLQQWRPVLQDALKEGGRQTGGQGGGRRLRDALVVCEVALSLVLLVGAGLLLRSFGNLLDVNLGIETRNVLTFRISLPSSKYGLGEGRTRFFDEALAGLASVPGVAGAAIVTVLPLEGGWNSDFEVEGLTWPEGHSPLAETRSVSPDYFRTMGIPLLSGRMLTEADTPDTARAVVVDAELVHQVFGSDDALGRRVLYADESWEIVGVVGDVQHWSLGEERRPAMYFPYRQLLNSSSMVVVVRCEADPLTYVASLRETIHGIDPDLPLSHVRTMQEVVGQDLARRRFSMNLLTAFTGLAVLLASIGLYGVISYSVGQRTQELGIRRTVGATTKDLMTLVFRQGARLTLAGIVLGLGGAFVMSRYLESLLFGVSTTDAGTIVTVTLVLVLVAAVSCLLPAQRASKVSPLVALRAE